MGQAACEDGGIVERLQKTESPVNGFDRGPLRRKSAVTQPTQSVTKCCEIPPSRDQ